MNGDGVEVAIRQVIVVDLAIANDDHRLGGQLVDRMMVCDRVIEWFPVKAKMRPDIEQRADVMLSLGMAGTKRVPRLRRRSKGLQRYE